MNKKTLWATCLFTFWLSPISAQNVEAPLSQRIPIEGLTLNAARLSLDTLGNTGYAEFGITHTNGDYTRVQEGTEHNALTFQAERIQQVGKYLVGYGRFTFDMERTQDRAWCDVYRPYDATPYYPGSTVKGKYDQQSFDFTGALGTINLGGWRFGARLDYKVGDLSRLRDPRSRSELLSYRITPSVAYTFGGVHTIGLAPTYNRRKEKMPTLTTVQNDPNLSYFELRGLENAYGSIGAYKGFSRQWVDHRLGGELSYGWQNAKVRSLTAIGFERGREEALEEEKRMPARYTSYNYSLTSQHHINDGKLLHEVRLDANYNQAYGDEFTQQRIQTTNAETGVTSYHYETLITYEKRYQTHRAEGMFHYRLNWLKDNKPHTFVGMAFSAASSYQKHLLPTSTFSHQRFAVVAESAKAFVNQRLWVALNMGYHFTSTDQKDLQLADALSVYAQQVLLPDMAYYTANYWRGHIEVKYTFPFKLKGVQSAAYVKATGDYLRTNNSLDRKMLGITLGIEN